MEVHGKQPDGQDMKYCQPCLDDGEQVAADGICQECDEFMCLPCITAHRRFRQFRNHIILEGYAMAQWASSESSLRSAPGSSHQESYEPCSIHQNELVKFYCSDHDQVGCGDCVVLDHRSCKVDYITDVVKQIDINREVTVLQESLKSTNGRVSGCLANMAATVKSNDDMNVKATKDIGQFAQEMIEYIQSEEKKLLKSVKKIKEDDNTTAESRMEKCQEEKRNVDAMEKRLRALTGIDVRTFTIVKSVKSELASTEKNVDKISKECETSRRNYSFKRNKALVSVVSSHSAPPLRHDRLSASFNWRARHTPSRDHCQPLGTLNHMRVRQAKPRHYADTLNYQQGLTFSDEEFNRGLCTSDNVNYQQGLTSSDEEFNRGLCTSDNVNYQQGLTCNDEEFNRGLCTSDNVNYQQGLTFSDEEFNRGLCTSDNVNYQQGLTSSDEEFNRGLCTSDNVNYQQGLTSSDEEFNRGLCTSDNVNYQQGLTSSGEEFN